MSAGPPRQQAAGDVAAGRIPQLDDDVIVPGLPAGLSQPCQPPLPVLPAGTVVQAPRLTVRDRSRGGDRRTGQSATEPARPSTAWTCRSPPVRSPRFWARTVPARRPLSSAVRASPAPTPALCGCWAWIRSTIGRRCPRGSGSPCSPVGRGAPCARWSCCATSRASTATRWMPTRWPIVSDWLRPGGHRSGACPVVSSSGCRWPPRWWGARRWSSSTSRRPVWTPLRGTRSGRYWPTCAPPGSPSCCVPT